MTTVLASGADERYGYWLLNLLGSVRANSDIFDRLVVYDLGLSPWQRRLLGSVRGVEIRTVPPFVPHWALGRTWKPWIWTHLEADELVWLDAGTTVLRSLAEMLGQVRQRGYFVVSQGLSNGPSIPSDYYALYGVDGALAETESVAAGIIAFDRRSAFYERVIVPTFEDVAAGRSVGFSAGEIEKLNQGLDRTDDPVVRDCPLFRHEQTVLNLRLYSACPDPVVNDLDRWAGWRSAHDHPQQVVWSHRRRGDYRYLQRLRFGPPLWLAGNLWGVGFRARWWARNHSWYFRPGSYVSKARRLLASHR
jgi:hypothetical protein